MKSGIKINSILQLYELLTEEEKIIVDVLRQFVWEIGKDTVKEKISYNVPFFFGKKSICLIWPASIPRGGIKKGVLFGFWYGHLLKDKNQYLDRGTNKQIFYKIFQTVEDIDFNKLGIVLREAIVLDKNRN